MTKIISKIQEDLLMLFSFYLFMKKIFMIPHSNPVRRNASIRNRSDEMFGLITSLDYLEDFTNSTTRDILFNLKNSL